MLKGNEIIYAREVGPLGQMSQSELLVSTQDIANLATLTPTPSNSITTTAVADAVLGGHRLVKINVNNKITYADNTDGFSSSEHLLGLTTQAGVPGDTITVTVSGIVEELSWSWDLTKPLFLGLNGLLIQDSPSTGCIVPCGFPLTGTKILFSPKTAITL